MNHLMDLNNVCLLVWIFQAEVILSFGVYVISHSILRTKFFMKSTYLILQIS